MDLAVILATSGYSRRLVFVLKWRRGIWPGLGSLFKTGFALGVVFCIEVRFAPGGR